MIGGHCEAARVLADRLAGIDGISVENEVFLNQLVLTFDDGCRDPDFLTAAMEKRLNADGEHFFRTSKWRNRNMLRISIIEDGTDLDAILKLVEKIIATWKDLQREDFPSEPA